ncbi:MAG: lipopolysaccharide transport periplasmic protein LptA [Gammaproteobacteria bacterium]|nr:lipopolysaccharide transport periplasmic protein LptA [Gammaproteobacteria bacterium]MCG3144489.1 Lipopolysaccharide export system protein LptA [Gammaproteobacteria bacterium]
MNPRTRILEALLFAAACGASGAAMALATDKDQPIEIEADYAELRKNERQTIYKGNVIVTQGSIRMWGDVLTVHYDENDELKDAVLEGKPAHFKQRPDGEGQDFEGEALRMEYHAQDERLHLINDAKLVQGKSSFAGPLIVYDTKNSILTGQGRPKTTSGGAEDGEKPPGGRVRMIIPPKEKKAAP